LEKNEGEMVMEMAVEVGMEMEMLEVDVKVGDLAPI